MDDGFREFIAYGGFLLRASRDVAVGPVGKCRALAFGLQGEVGNIHAGEFDLCFLVFGGIC